VGFLLLAAIAVGPAIAFISTVAFIFGGGLSAVAITLSLLAAGMLHAAADDLENGDWEAIFREWSAFELRVASALSRIVRFAVFVFKQLSTEKDGE